MTDPTAGTQQRPSIRARLTSSTTPCSLRDQALSLTKRSGHGAVNRSEPAQQGQPVGPLRARRPAARLQLPEERGDRLDHPAGVIKQPMRRERVPAGRVVEPVASFLGELQACGRSASTQRSYGLALLRWLRFMAAVDVAWDQATRVEARDFCRWIQIAAKPVRPHWRRPGQTAGSQPASVRAPAAPNPVTGKATPGVRHAPATAAHSETVVRGFYEFVCPARGRGLM